MFSSFYLSRKHGKHIYICQSRANRKNKHTFLYLLIFLFFCPADFFLPLKKHNFVFYDYL